jgi:ferredoxin-NADP reductase
MVEEKSYVFIAAGIGITPFRSMIHGLVARMEKKDITLLYQARNEEELLFRDLFDKAEEVIGLQTIYVLSNPPQNWTGEQGYISKEFLSKFVPDLKSRVFYVSGPQEFVEKTRDMLMEIDIRLDNIKTDLFTGYA